MNRKLVPFSKLSKQTSKVSDASVVVDKNGIPLGFVFGRNSFISLCTVIDDEFEKRVNDPKKAYDNPAGRLIDAIEEKLPLNPNFVNELKALKNNKKSDSISLNELARYLNV